jgi:hypothetical protein
VLPAVKGCRSPLLTARRVWTAFRA